MTDAKTLTIGQAVDQLISVLEWLDSKTRSTVLGIVFRLLGINFEEAVASKSEGQGGAGKSARTSAAVDEAEGTKRKGQSIDVRALKEEKKPRSAIEMAAIV